MYRLLCVLSAIVLLIAGARAQQQSAPQSGDSDLYYYYFDQPVPLKLDTTRIAVFERGELQTIGARLGGRAFVESTEVYSLPGWTMTQLAQSAQRSASVRRHVIDLAQTIDVDFASPVLYDQRGELVIIQPEILVGFASSVSEARARAILAARGNVLEAHAYGMPGTYRLDIGSRNGFEVLAAANALAEHPQVAYAEPDMILTAVHGHVPNDPLFGNQWGLNNTGQFGGTPDMDMDATEAWDISTGDSSVLVAVLDDGVQLDHPDLNLATGVTFTGTSSNGNPGNACDNHGTSVAGTISETIDNGLGGSGVAPNCRAIAMKFTIAQVPCTGSGSFAISWLTSALDYCEVNGIRVTNNSNSLGVSSTLTNKYNSTHANGMVHFSSTGNSGAGSISYPSNLASVNAIGALNPSGNRASFSQFGTGIGFCTPGETIMTTDRTGSAGYVSGDYLFANGTSYSSPYAAGLAGLVLSVNPSLSADDVENILNSSCVDRGAAGYDTVYGWGFGNAHQALLAAGGPPLAITSLSPSSTVEVLVPGTAQFLSINGTGFTGSIDLTYDGALVDASRYTVVSDTLITLDPPQAAIGNVTLWVENESQADSTTVNVIASTTLQHQVGNGDLDNPISTGPGGEAVFLISGPVGWQTRTYYSLNGLPSIHPVVTLCMGNNFASIFLLTSSIIPAQGYVEYRVPIAGVAPGLTVYSQGLVIDQGSPWPVSNCQSFVTAP